MAKQKQVKKNAPVIENSPKAKPAPLTLPGNFWKSEGWKVAVLIIFGFVLYHQTAHYGYVLDDTIVITDNQFTKKGFGGIYEIMTTESMTGYFGAQKNLVQGNRYRPLSLVTFAIEYGVFNKMNPGVSHVINILLYILSCIFILRAFQLLMPDKKSLMGWLDIGFAASLLYLVHPIHVEAVANIKGRDEIMAMLFSLLSLYLFALHFLYGKGKTYLYAALISYFLGLLSKENTITFAAVIPLTLWVFGGPHRNKAWNSLAWLVLVSFIYLMMRFSISGVPQLNQKITDIMNNPFLEMSGGEKLATILYTLGLYIKLLIFPYPLTHDYYPYAIPIMNWSKWQVWLSLVLYGGMIWWAWKQLKEKQLSGYAISFYLITLTIVSNIVINLGTFMNDRFIYMPSLGFCLLLAWAVWKIGEKWGSQIKEGAQVALLGVAVIAFAFLSFIRVPDWETALSLNQSAMRVSGNSARANSFMATALFNEFKETTDVVRKKSLLKEAMPYAKKAAEIIPNYYNANLMMAGIAGESYNLNKELTPLLSDFQQVVSRRPDVSFVTEYLKYLNGTGPDLNQMMAFYIKVGKTLMEKKGTEDIKWAAHYMKLGLELDPNQPTLNQLTGECFNLLGDTQQAQMHMSKAAGLR
jgi:tetratricopeptide (TPR) repeat protein